MGQVIHRVVAHLHLDGDNNHRQVTTKVVNIPAVPGVREHPEALTLVLAFSPVSDWERLVAICLAAEGECDLQRFLQISM